MAAQEGKDRDRVKAVLLEVFGTSDDEDDSSEQHPRINGLYHCRNHVNRALQETTMKGVEAEGWFETAEMNQAMCFGSLPGWAKDLADALPTDLFSRKIQSRQPLFDQLTVNVYAPGEGITAHVDLDRFEDGIAIVSLGSAAIMDYTRDECHERLLLQPGDVLLLEGEARYQWKHGIAAVATEQFGGLHIQRGWRTSITFRKLVPGG
ncbi:probable Alkylated DNA repair protein alkB homolog 8 [Coccomyxa sp. Obi]|nr:probable Alkylated DNA repair protein alkB homolog 8 [Coccomyxa sp. Obi]